MSSTGSAIPPNGLKRNYDADDDDDLDSHGNDLMIEYKMEGHINMGHGGKVKEQFLYSFTVSLNNGSDCIMDSGFSFWIQT